MSTNEEASLQSKLHEEAKFYFPDTTIFENHYLFGHEIPSLDSFRMLVYEYSAEDTPDNHFFITNFHPTGRAIDVLKAKPLSMDGNLSINLVDGEILELIYADFYLDPSFFQSDRFYCKVPDSLQQVHTEEHTSLKKYVKQKDYHQLNFYEYYKIDINGQFEQLKTNNQVDARRKYPFASTRVLSFEELDRYTVRQLEMMVHEIEADHGKIFESRSLQRYFKRKKWYQPLFDQIEASLNDIEKINISKIREQLLTY